MGPKSYELLAQMNELGFITFDSQDAPNKKTEKFIELFNLKTDLIAHVTVPIIKTKWDKLYTFHVTAQNKK